MSEEPPNYANLELTLKGADLLTGLSPDFGDNHRGNGQAFAYNPISI